MGLSLIHTAEQSHGKIIEDQIKAAFPGSSDHKRAPNEKFDVEARFDKIHRLPSSIKTSKGSTIGLADARRTWSINEDFRLIVVNYNQQGKYKVPTKLFEFLITKEEWNELKGDFPAEEIENFHNALAKYPEGTHTEARSFSKSEKNRLCEKYKSSIMINPKIDSKTQRRLQASISLSVLTQKIKTINIFEVNELKIIPYRGVSIAPVESVSRSVRKELKAEEALQNEVEVIKDFSTATQLDLFSE